MNPMRTASARKVLSALFVGACAVSVILALIPLAFVLFFVVSQGIQSLNLDFFRNNPRPVGEPGGGMANAIVGTLILTGLAAAMAVPIGILSGVYLSEYRGSRFASAVRFAADTLNGVPSIVIGVFAYGVAVLPLQHFSTLAGGLALGIMMFPIIARTTEELLLLVPDALREGALALGATRARAIFSVIVPAALPGIITASCWRSLESRERPRRSCLHRSTTVSFPRRCRSRSRPSRSRYSPMRSRRTKTGTGRRGRARSCSSPS